MRILRVRRGFTTNSSGDNEYLPIIPPPPAPPDGGVTAVLDAGAARADAAARTTAPDAGRRATKDARADAGAHVVAVDRPSAATGAPATAAPQGSSLTLVWVIVGVLAIFVAERLLRVLRKRSKEPGPERPGPERPAPEEPSPEKPGDDGQA